LASFNLSSESKSKIDEVTEVTVLFYKHHPIFKSQDFPPAVLPQPGS
jgi:hypothetical protein